MGFCGLLLWMDVVVRKEVFQDSRKKAKKKNPYPFGSLLEFAG